MPLPASAIAVRRRFLAARDVQVLRFHTPGGVDHDQSTHGHGSGPREGKQGEGRSLSIAVRSDRGTKMLDVLKNPDATQLKRWAGRDVGTVRGVLDLRTGNLFLYDSAEVVHIEAIKGLEKAGEMARGTGNPWWHIEEKVTALASRLEKEKTGEFRFPTIDQGGTYEYMSASGKAFFGVSRTPSRAASRCNFAAIKQRENALAKTAVPEAAAAIARAVKRALGDDEQLVSLLDDDPQDIAALALNGADVGRIRSAFDGALETAFETGRVTGANEVARAGGQVVKMRREAFHTPGGHEHDQKDHAGDGEGEAQPRDLTTPKGVAAAFKETQGTDHAVNAALLKEAGVKVDGAASAAEDLATAAAFVAQDLALREPLRGTTIGVLSGKLGTGLHGRHKGNTLYVSAESLRQHGPGFVAGIIRHELEHKILTARGVPSAAQESQVRFKAGLWAGLQGSSMALIERNPRVAEGLRKAAEEQGHKVRLKHSFAALREKAAGYIAANGFRMAENVSEATRAIIQAELLTGVKVGKRPAVVREAIWDALVRKGLTSRAASLGVETDEAVVGALNALWVDEEEDAAHYLDTLVRTNSFEAMNEARFEEFTDPALGGFVQALEYSAILDDNTTEICTHLDGRIYAAQSDVWDIYRPPNHYNCRSLLIPVTAIDGWDGVESDAPSVEPQAGFFTRCSHAEHFHLPGGHDQSTHGHGGGESDQRIGDRPVFDAGGDSASYVHQTHSSAVESITKNGLRPSDGQYGKAVYLADSAKANIGRGYTDIALDVRLKEGTRAVEVSGLTAFYKLVESVGTPADATDPGPYLVKAGLDAVKVKQLDGSSYMIVYNPSAITVAKVRG